MTSATSPVTFGRTHGAHCIALAGLTNTAQLLQAVPSELCKHYTSHVGALKVLKTFNLTELC